MALAFMGSQSWITAGTVFAPVLWRASSRLKPSTISKTPSTSITVRGSSISSGLRREGRPPSSPLR